VNHSNDHLLIRGKGDPYLVSEEITVICNTLKKKGIGKIRKLVLDTSAFSENLKTSGLAGSLNPYDALNGALAVNFNTIYIRKNSKGIISSAEEQTPLTPLAIEKAKFIKRRSLERINISTDPSESLQYVGELFEAILKKRGMIIKKPQIVQGKLNKQWKLLYTHRNSRYLAEMLQGLLMYSNNYIANQIFLLLGANAFDFPADFDKSRKMVQQYLKTKFSADWKNINFDEASGISRKNSLSAAFLMKVLDRFKDNFLMLRTKGGVYLKSGTLDGVYNYAGYILTDKGLRGFVIILNQPRNTRDKILSLLESVM